MKTRLFFSLLLMVLALPSVHAGDWSESAKVMHRADSVVTYRAKLQGDILLIEAAHKANWHTYAIDNVERARRKTGKEVPETELPTVFVVSGGLKTVGNWRQTKPKDLSQTEIKWYTWGFEDTARFAVRVARAGDGDARIEVKGQACNASSCSMISGITLTVPVTGAGDSSFDLSTLVETIQPEGAEKSGG